MEPLITQCNVFHCSDVPLVPENFISGDLVLTNVCVCVFFFHHHHPHTRNKVHLLMFKKFLCIFRVLNSFLKFILKRNFYYDKSHCRNYNLRV